MTTKSKKRFVFEMTGDCELYLAYFVDDSLNESCLKVPLSTLVTVFLVRIMEGMDGAALPNVRIYLKPETFNDNGSTAVIVNRSCLEGATILTSGDLCQDKLVSSCVLPAILFPTQQLCVTGICSVLRRLLKTGSCPRPSESLLGYQGNCLSAPAEVSSWTRFCEIDLPETTSRILASKTSLIQADQDLELPVDVARFEEHMRQPIRMHNIRKRMGQVTSSSNGNLIDQDGGGQTKSKSGDVKVTENGRQLVVDEHGREVDPIEIYARTQHVFAEGPDCLLSDLVVFPLMSIVSEKFIEVVGRESFEQAVPLTSRWMRKLDNFINATSVLRSILCPSDLDFQKLSLDLQPGRADKPLRLPQVPDQSLYKSDPKRNNPASRVFTRQHEIERVLGFVDGLGLQLFSSTSDSAPSSGHLIDWSSLPSDVHPMGGELPPDRAEKKCQQLENMSAAILELCKDGDTVVDFCSGGGHLGILVAYLKPSVTVILVENKEESLMRAVSRVTRLGLGSCRFFQGNMDYFHGKFNVGVSLHACGVATDLVIKACIDNRASFVSCPCCYGSVQENHILEYPRSQHFQSNNIGFKDYIILGHTADQTHVTNAKHEQGQFCMDFVDSDRVHLALESGYSDVTLIKMKPESCSPKNNLIVATFQK